MDLHLLGRLTATSLIVAMLALPVFAGAIVKGNEQVATVAFSVVFVAVFCAILWGATAGLVLIWG